MPKCHVNNIGLFYEVYGEGEPLLFLHGLGSSTQDWEKQVPLFAQKYKVYLLDLRGHGDASHRTREGAEAPRRGWKGSCRT